MNHRRQYISKIIIENDLKSYAELGVRDGRCFNYVMDACDDLEKAYAIDIWDNLPNDEETYETWPHEENHNKILRMQRKFPERIDVLKMTTEFAASVVPNSLDIIFIDAAHDTKGVLEDIQNWFPKVSDEGFIVFHDIDWESVQKAVYTVFDPGLVAIGPDNCALVRKNSFAKIGFSAWSSSDSE